MHDRRRAWVVLVLLSPALTAQAPDSRWQLSGFGTLGLTFNTPGLSGYQRDISQPPGTTRSLDPRQDSRLGAQVNLKVTDDFAFAGQVVSKYRYDGTFTPDLTWAFLSYSPTSGILARAGRLGWDVFPLADTRNVGYSYLWVRPPVDFFGPLAISSVDGADFSWTSSVSEGRSLRLKVSAGQASETVPTISGPPLNLSGGRLLSALAEYQQGGLSLRVAYAQFRMVTALPQSTAELQAGLAGLATELDDPRLAEKASEMEFNNRLLQYLSIGLSWQRDNVQIEAAGAQVTSGSGLIPDFKSGFVSVGYRQEQVVPYLMVSRIVTPTSNPYLGALPTLGPSVAPLEGGLLSLAQASQANQTTLSPGFRWDFCSKADLKFQVDRVLATPHALFLYSAAKPGWDGKATLVSLLVDFVF